MAAPSPTARGTPTGLPIDDGQHTFITLLLYPTIMFWEKSVQPSGVDNGAPIIVTTMFNTNRHTKAPRTLNDYTDASCKVCYDPAVIDQIHLACGVETTITVTYPNGDTDADYGYLKDFKRDTIEEGKQPEATATFVFTGRDSSRTEQEPVFTPKTGT